MICMIPTTSSPLNETKADHLIGQPVNRFFTLEFLSAVPASTANIRQTRTLQVGPRNHEQHNKRHLPESILARRRGGRVAGRKGLCG